MIKQSWKNTYHLPINTILQVVWDFLNSSHIGIFCWIILLWSDKMVQFKNLTTDDYKQISHYWRLKNLGSEATALSVEKLETLRNFENWSTDFLCQKFHNWINIFLFIFLNFFKTDIKQCYLMFGLLVFFKKKKP